MKKSVLLITILLCVAGITSLAAQAGSDSPQFVHDMIQHLQQYGWTETQITQFRVAAMEQQMEQNWDKVEGGDPQIVAMALRLANQDREQLQGAENADLALELAHMARSMERLGFQQREIAKTTFEGTRDIVQNMQQMRAQIQVNADNGTGDMTRIRERIRERIRTHLDEIVEKQTRAQEMAAQRNRQTEGRLDGSIGKPDGVPGGKH